MGIMTGSPEQPQDVNKTWTRAPVLTEYNPGLFAEHVVEHLERLQYSWAVWQYVTSSTPLDTEIKGNH